MAGAEQDPDQLIRQARDLESADRQPEAVLIYGELLHGPKHLEALQALARISFENGDLRAADHFFGESLKIVPNFVEGLHLRGVALMRLGRNEAALDCLERAVQLDPNGCEAILNHATLLLEMKRADEALAGFDRVLAIEPNNAVAWNNRGNTLVALGRLEEGVAAYDRALVLDPRLQAAAYNHFYALLSLRRVDRISDFAARQAFDQVASRYDQIVRDELHYRAHHDLRALASRVAGSLAPPLRILDLGCGTGLAGECFKDLASGGRLDGVDISPGMIEEARKRGIYNDLVIADFEIYLSRSGPHYDLVLSADAIVYFGALGAIFAGVAKRLEPTGVFLFTCEAKPGDGWELTEANRFRHSEAYLRGEAERAALSWIEAVECIPRSERGTPVAGLAVALRKPAE
jgi:predicted TPR repeat methyltransferase